MPKRALRSELLSRRAALPESFRISAGLAAQQLLLSLDLFSRATTVALYAPVRGEVATDLLFQAALAGGKQVLLPRVAGDMLRFSAATSQGLLVRGPFGIPQPPEESQETPLEAADLIVVPGVAFDRHGHRLGFGKGYYDRCLSALGSPIPRIGLCYDFQLVPLLPAEGHDVRMHLIVTERQVLAVKGAGKAGTGESPD